jgi:hypothetical protein
MQQTGPNLTFIPGAFLENSIVQGFADFSA